MIRRLPHALLWAVCSAGCVNEYHPEYHPVSVTTVNPIAQERERPFIHVEPTVTPPASTLPRYHSRDGVSARDYRALFDGDAGDPFAISEQYAPPKAVPQTIIGRGVTIGGNVQFNGNVTFNGDVYIDARHP